MSDTNLPAALATFATEAVDAGVYRDLSEIRRAYEEERRAFAAALQAVEAEADQMGCIPIEQVDGGMRAAIRAAAKGGL